MADDPLARGGLAVLVGAEPGLTVVAQVAAADRWGRILEAYAPEVAVWDLGSALPEHPPDFERLGVPVLALVADEEGASDALAARAGGVVFRDTEGPRLAAALLALSRGLVVVEAGLADAWRRPRGTGAAVEALTPRERQVLDLLAQGLSNRAVGERLGIGERTAKFHVNAILAKLGAETRTEAVVIAARLGLVAL